MSSGVQVKRAYESPAADDGYRVLIDRLWPRGVSKEKAQIDEWAKDLAPSTELRRWYGHVPARYAEFRRRYRDELVPHKAEIEALRARAAKDKLTIVIGAKDMRHSNGAVLLELLE